MKKSQLRQIIKKVIAEQGAGPRPAFGASSGGTQTLGDWVNNFEGAPGCTPQQLQAVGRADSSLDMSTPVAHKSPAHAVAAGVACVYYIGWSLGWW